MGIPDEGPSGWAPSGASIRVDTDGVKGFASNMMRETSTFQSNLSTGVQPLMSTALSATGQSGMQEAGFFAQQHQKYYTGAMLLAQDAEKGLMALAVGATTVAANYLLADAESSAKVSDVTEAFDTPPGRRSLDEQLRMNAEQSAGTEQTPEEKKAEEERLLARAQSMTQQGSPTDVGGGENGPNGSESGRTIRMGEYEYYLSGDYQGIESSQSWREIVENRKAYEETWDGKAPPPPPPPEYYTYY